MPTLTQVIIRRLGSSNMEHKVIASNALGELIRRAGDGVLSSLLPTLEEGLQTSTDTDAKQGICLALKELIASASPEALEDHEKILISVVRTALTDSDEDAREAAAEAFDSLQQIFGKRAVDQVLLHLAQSSQARRRSGQCPRCSSDPPNGDHKIQHHPAEPHPYSYCTAHIGVQRQSLGIAIQGGWRRYEPPLAQYHQLAHG